MSAGRFPVLPGETPFEWSARVLKAYDEGDPRTRDVERERNPSVREMVAEAKRTPADPADPLTDLVGLFADLPEHLKQEPAERSLDEALLDGLPTRGH